MKDTEWFLVLVIIFTTLAALLVQNQHILWDAAKFMRTGG